MTLNYNFVTIYQILHPIFLTVKNTSKMHKLKNAILKTTYKMGIG